MTAKVSSQIDDVESKIRNFETAIAKLGHTYASETESDRKEAIKQQLDRWWSEKQQLQEQVVLLRKKDVLLQEEKLVNLKHEHPISHSGGADSLVTLSR